MSEVTLGGSQEHRTVSRVTGILEYAARRVDGVRLTDIVAHLDAPRSSVHGLVHGLVSAGYLRIDEAGRYFIGSAVNALLMPRSSFDNAVRAIMEILNQEFDETVTAVSLAGNSIVSTDAIQSSQAVRYNPTLGIRRPLYPTSAGKCFLAFSSEMFREKFIAANFSDSAERDRVRAELLAVSADGVAVNRGDTLPDLHAVSTPVFNGTKVEAVITVAGPSSRISANLDRIVASSKKAAGLASRF